MRVGVAVAGVVVAFAIPVRVGVTVVGSFVVRGRVVRRPLVVVPTAGVAGAVVVSVARVTLADVRLAMRWPVGDAHARQFGFQGGFGGRLPIELHPHDTGGRDLRLDHAAERPCPLPQRARSPCMHDGRLEQQVAEAIGELRSSGVRRRRTCGSEMNAGS